MAESSTLKTLGRSLLRNAAGIMGSRVTGLLRDVAVSAFWGATGIFQAAYTTAFGLTNSLRQLFGEGAFSSAFVPMFSERLERDGKGNSAWQLANRAITLQCIVLGLLTIIGSCLAILLWHMRYFGGNQVRNVAMLIMPLVLPYALLICVSGAFGAVLNSMQVFLLPSAVQMIFNLVQIGTVCYLGFFWTNEDFTALGIFCLSTLLSGLLELLVLLVNCRRRGYRFELDCHFFSADVLLLCRKIVPGMIGAGLHQLNYLVDVIIGTYLGSVAVGALCYSQRLVYLPIGIFGAAMSMVCLPALSRANARGDTDAVCKAFNYSIQTVLFMALPATAFLAICGRQLIALFFQRGAFTEQATLECTWALLFYIIGLPAFCIAKIAANPFHARLDTKTPMLVGLAGLLLNLILNLLLMKPLQQGGLALSTSICSWLNVIVLMALNKRHLPQWSPREPIRSAVAYAAAAFISAFATWVFVTHFSHSAYNTFIRLVLVAVSLGIAGASYIGICLLLRKEDTKAFFRMAFHRKR